MSVGVVFEVSQAIPGPVWALSVRELSQLAGQAGPLGYFSGTVHGTILPAMMIVN